ncbi:MAG: dual specificity protein phosphatase family protein [Pirellulaceae bacterium]|nr:dual specificity protein phosphatase family protein [Pirellulaceae bacterium]HJN11177.1 dual specificity protein phosphatase family protein [Pirellulaceae bacterium]
MNSQPLMDFSEILPNLFVGSCPRTPDHVDTLSETGITAVLNVQTADDLAYWQIEWHDMQTCYDEHQIEVRRIPVQDFNPDILRRKLPDCVAALQDLLQAGHTVFVHCYVGMNRSPSTVIAYLHWIEQRALDEAILHVCQRRHCEPYVDAIKLATQDREKKLPS